MSNLNVTQLLDSLRAQRNPEVAALITLAQRVEELNDTIQYKQNAYEAEQNSLKKRKRDLEEAQREKEEILKAINKLMDIKDPESFADRLKDTKE